MALLAEDGDTSGGDWVDISLFWDLALGFQLFITAVFVLLVVKIIRVSKRDAAGPEYRSVAILVLGDIGRSPRMMYHAQSFAGHNFMTYVIAYGGSELVQPLRRSVPHVRFMYIPEPPKFISKLPRLLFLLLAPLKVAYQVWSVLEAFMFEIAQAPQYILVQNPPTIPSLAIVWLVARLRGSKVIIDWHNLGYTILAMKLGENSRFVKLAEKFERYFGQTAFAHLFVTNAMKEFLVKNWNLQGHKIVLYDRPPASFHRCSTSEMHDLFVRLMPYINTDLAWFPRFRLPSTTPFTEVVRSPRNLSIDMSLLEPRTMPTLRHERPAILITSTSWTPDEDFSILIEGLRHYEHKARAQYPNDSQPRGSGVQTRGAMRRANNRAMSMLLPKVLVFVTGKGPLREKYMRDLEKLRTEEGWEWIRVISIWLEPEDYPRLLGSCDLGISLHSSSSALDLPMKIVDMFGCQLPVCALNFACLEELVKDGQNGLIFEDANGLAKHLETLLRGFPDSEPLSKLRSGFQPLHSSPSSRRRAGWSTWDQNWDDNVKPLVISESSQQADDWLRNFVERKRLSSPSRSGYGSDPTG